MFSFISRWRQRRILQRSTISATDWSRAFQRLPLLNRLDADERQRLQVLATVFLHDKQLIGKGTVVLNQAMRLVIALQACLPILNLGMSWYQGWSSVLVYPDDFTAERDEVDAAGVVHRVRHRLAGEAWSDGPVILSWNDVREAGAIDGTNLVVHEFSHKLDMRNGVANGFPPLHKGMSVAAWSDAMSSAFSHFQAREENGQTLPFDGYAASSPAEFFAVLSEVFFEQPAAIADHYPAVYDLLSAFYRQDPLPEMS